ncbi:DUF1330 domain-containing protein [Massilia sp. 9096]|uniref:DUF1330 domain-containing protein n=1 Tax=Massilia sp. 9096 TaxID=1500894 RepID=UPI00055A9AA7|nr:DUF1330 domain-containing protein [Massilia sp. 9096]
MPKGYLIGHVNILDTDTYAAYAKAAAEAMAPFAPKLIAAGRYENLEGSTHERHVVFEFESFEEARRFYDSPAYRAARQLRAGAASGTFVLLEGMS